MYSSEKRVVLGLSSEQKTSRATGMQHRTPQIDFHGACIVNEDGSETPITEAMVQQAFKELIEEWEGQHPQH